MGQQESIRCQTCIQIDEKAPTIHVDPTDVVDGNIHLSDDIVGHAYSEITVIEKNNERVAYISADGMTREFIRFKVAISKQANEPFGLAHMPMEDGSQSLLVVELRSEGPIAKWNMEQQALGLNDFTMRRGDRIVCVDTDYDIERMREKLRKNDIDFVVERWPENVPVRLKKGSPTDKYGMQTDLIAREDGTKVLRVGRISGGLLGDWNALAASERRYCEIVSQHSEITSVNECKEPERMQQLLVTEAEVRVTFKRPDPDLYNQQ